jgi:hypothetical protein
LSADEIAKTVGYSKEDLAILPAGANMGLSWGNPVAIAQLKRGETVLDLGSGGGFDVFQAARSHRLQISFQDAGVTGNSPVRTEIPSF